MPVAAGGAQGQPIQGGGLPGPALFATPPGQGNLPPGARFAAGPAPSPYPVDFHRSGIAVGYANDEYIADLILPRLAALMRREYRFNRYPIEEHFTVPPTRVGRRSAPAMVHLSSAEDTRSVEDYGLDDAIPADDVTNTAPTAMNPIDRASMVLTDLLMIARELRVAELVFNPAHYPDTNKITLSGSSQWTHADSNPLRDIVAAQTGMIVKPTDIAMGEEVFAALRTHPRMLKATHANDGDSGIASREAMERVLMLRIHVGSARVNTARPGQAANLARCWGKHALLYRRDPNTDYKGPPSLGFTAPYLGRQVMVGFDPRIGVRGTYVVRVVDSCDEAMVAKLAGYFFRNAVA
ncbi:hypothetical protein [Ruegeria sp.]